MMEFDELIKTRDVIRKKFNAFRHGEEETSIQLEKQFKPLTDPLKAILKAQTGRIPNEPVNEEEKEKGEDIEELDPEAEAGATDETSEDELFDVLEKNYGPQVSVYLYDKLTSSAFAGKVYDETYGVRRDKNTNGWAIGNQRISFDNEGSLKVGEAKFDPDPGFLELIFKKHPQGFTKQDLAQYREVLEMTDGHKRFFKKDEPVDSNRSKKYKDIISKLFPPERQQKKKSMKRKVGSGILIPRDLKSIDSSKQVFVPHDPKDRVFVYWDDPNELIERLALLTASKDAGHTGHDREILSIVEELREAGYIE